MGLTKVIQSCWCTLVEIYEEFSLESSIHGIKYTTTAKSTTARFFWVITLISSLLAAMRLAQLFYERHQAASISTPIINDHFPIWQLELPAITLCEGNIAVMQKVQSFLTSRKRIYLPRGITREDFEKALHYLHESIYPQNHFPDELDKLQQILSANRLSLLELFENVSPNCTDLFVMCQFEGKTMACEELVRPVITSYGICCSFNYENPRDRSPSATKTGRKFSSAFFGHNFILSFLLKPYSARDRISSLYFGEGMHVLIHERNTHPTPAALQFFVALEHETIAQLNPVRVISSSEILRLPPEVRGCRSSSRKSFYRADNCEANCRDSVVHKSCGCHPFSALNVGPDEQICNLTQTPCLARVVPRLQWFTQHDSTCNCLPNCEATSYRVAVTSFPLNAPRYSSRRLYKEAQKHESATILHIGYASQSAILHRRQLTLPVINLVSSLGGVFGLFLGCSFVSLFEIIYFFCIHIIRKAKEKIMA